MRKLAHIERITNIRPIEGADRIVVADLLGWEVVVGKDEFKIGDLACYFEIDSFLDGSDPRYASFEERFVNWGKKRGMRLKTIKLRKQISQGLLMPLSKFPEIKNPKEGDDVTEILKIEKWEPPEETSSNNGGHKFAAGKPFPAFVPKTDQERIQNYIGQLPKHMNESFEVTIKLDGSSMTVYSLNKNSPFYDTAFEMKQNKIKGGRWNRLLKFIYKAKKFFGLIKKPDIISAVCSRNLQLKDHDGSHFWNYVDSNHVIQNIEKLNKNYAFQGELIGPSIQENYEKVSDFQYHIYDVYDIDEGKYLLPEEARNVCHDVGLKHVPVIHSEFYLKSLGENLDTKELVQKILDMAEGPGLNSGVKREGIVFKSNKQDFSFKAISNHYLLSKSKREK